MSINFVSVVCRQNHYTYYGGYYKIHIIPYKKHCSSIAKNIFLFCLLLISFIECNNDVNPVTFNERTDTLYVFTTDTLIIASDTLVITMSDTTYLMGDTLVIYDTLIVLNDSTQTTGSNNDTEDETVASTNTVHGKVDSVDSWFMVEAISNSIMRKIVYLENDSSFEFVNLPSGEYQFNYYTKARGNESQTYTINHSSTQSISLPDMTFSTSSTSANVGAVAFVKDNNTSLTHFEIYKSRTHVGSFSLPSGTDTLFIPLPVGTFNAIIWASGISNLEKAT